MSRYCDNCQRYSGDEREVCPRCGEALPLPETPSEHGAEAPGNLLHTVAKIVVLGIFLVVVVSRYREQLVPVFQSANAGVQRIATWLVGSDAQNMPYITLAIGLSIFFWLTLWIINKLTP